MRAYPRTRKTVKWGGAATTVALVAIGFVSGPRNAYWIATTQTIIGVARGTITIEHVADDGETILEPGAYIKRGNFEWRWWFDWRSMDAWYYFCTPIWVLAVPCLTGTVAAWRLDTLARRRARVGCCPKCGYDRAGLAAAAVCPECGAGPAAATPPAAL